MAASKKLYESLAQGLLNCRDDVTYAAYRKIVSSPEVLTTSLELFHLTNVRIGTTLARYSFHSPHALTNLSLSKLELSS